jgi:hypothetical protein
MPGKNETTDDAHSGDDHLSDVEDGCGCAEVWEHLSEQRAGDD